MHDEILRKNTTQKRKKMNNEFPTLEMVKHHFRNAQKVKCLIGWDIFDLDNASDKGIHQFRHSYWVTNKNLNLKGIQNSVMLYDHDGQRYAEITEYKKLKP